MDEFNKEERVEEELPVSTLEDEALESEDTTGALVGEPEAESQDTSPVPGEEIPGMSEPELDEDVEDQPQDPVQATDEAGEASSEPEPAIGSEVAEDPAAREMEAEPETDPEAQASTIEGELTPETGQAEVQADAADEQQLVVAPEAEAEDNAGDEESAALAQEEEVAEIDDDRQWYVVHCYSGYENKVRHNLEQRIETMGMKNRIFDVVVPTEEEMEVRDGKRRTVERRVFPGYILVQMLMSEDSWYVVRNTPGVTGFVGMGNDPTPLRPEEVSQIIRRMEAEAPRIKVTYAIGQKVRIIDGPFNDFIGTVDDIDIERAKVRVMVSFFGRETPVELDFLQVEKA